MAPGTNGVTRVLDMNWLVLEWFWYTSTTPLLTRIFSLLKPVLGLNDWDDSGAMEDLRYNNLSANKNAVQWANSLGLDISTCWYIRINISGVIGSACFADFANFLFKPLNKTLNSNESPWYWWPVNSCKNFTLDNICWIWSKPQVRDINSTKPSRAFLETGRKGSWKATQNMLSCFKWLRTLSLDFLA